jgi:hypothetical protein
VLPAHGRAAALFLPRRLANALGALGRLDEARAAWQRVAAIHPAFPAAAYAYDIQLQALAPERAEPHLAGLRKAGLLQ